MELGDPGMEKLGQCLLFGGESVHKRRETQAAGDKGWEGGGPDFYESRREEAGARAAAWGMSERTLVRNLHIPGPLLGENLNFWSCGLGGDLLSLRAEWRWVPEGGRNSTAAALMKTDLPPSWCGTCNCRVETITLKGDVPPEKTRNSRHWTPPSPDFTCLHFLHCPLPCMLRDSYTS